MAERKTGERRPLPSFPSASCFFFFSLASLDFLAHVTILRDCSQSTFTTDYVFIFRYEACWSRAGREFQQGQVGETGIIRLVG